MNSNKMIIEFLNQISIEEKKRYLNNDNLIYLLAEEFKDDFIFDDTVKSNLKILFAGFQGVLLKIATVFKENNISYIMFKGIPLACALYDEPYRRSIGDIDVFVESNVYNIALALLIRMNYKIKYEKGIENPHHIVLTNDKVTIELHKNLYHPMIGIRENFLRTNLASYTIKKHEVLTFNKTAIILHLIYHLYMDTCLSSNNIYAISTNKSYGIAKRFLYRAYEIALFAEKFFDDIKWDDIISDIKTQKLRIVFKYMVEDILEIFPNAFPAKLVDAINSLEYVSEQNDDVYKIIRTAKAVNDNNGDLLLSKYIDENWNYNNTATCKHLGECFEISKPDGEESCKNKTLSGARARRTTSSTRSMPTSRRR